MKDIIKFFFKRLIGAIITLIAVLVLVFFIIHFIPGSPFSSEANLPDNIKQNIINKYGLDEPLTKQLLTYFLDVLHGDFGMSIKSNGRMVTDIIKEHLPISMLIGGISIIICLIIAIPLGIIASTHESKVIDWIVRTLSIITASTPRIYNSSIITIFILCKIKMASIILFKQFCFINSTNYSFSYISFFNYISVS